MWMDLFLDPANLSFMGQVKILHRHSYFTGHMSRPADPNVHNMMYAFMEDFQAGQQIYTISILDTYFNNTQHFQVPDWAVLNQAVDANALPNVYSPYAHNNVGTKVLQTWSTCWIVPTYATIIIPLKDQTPQNFLCVIRQKIVSDRHTTDCISALDWLHLALT
jgi:hypothetical protein